MMPRQGDESAAGAVMHSADTPVPRINDEQRRRAVAAVTRRFGTWTDAAGVPHATPESAEMLLALFCLTPRRGGKRPAAPAVKPHQTDPAYSQHPPEDIGAWRTVVCEWGRENGWPNAHGKKPLDPAMLAAYRAAHAKQPKASPPPLPKNHVGMSAEAVALRQRMRAFGRANGIPAHDHGTPNPVLARAYYDEHPEEAL